MTVPKPSSAEYFRRLGVFDTTMIVIGGIIGAGIFLNPAIVAQRVHTSAFILSVGLRRICIRGIARPREGF